MFAWYFLPTSRKCENSFWLSSPGLSHENTTNCEGFCPGTKRRAMGCFDRLPVKTVEPSPMSRNTLLDAAR